MKKIALILLVGASFASDRAGQGNTITVGDLVTQLYNEMVNYTSSPEKHWDTTSVLIALENAGQATLNRFEACKRDTAIDMISGTETYSLPSDFLRARYATAIEDGQKLEIVMKEMLPTQVGMYRDPEGIPAKYFIHDVTTIHIEPANNSGDTVRLYYVPNVAAMDSVQDTTNIDRAFKDYLVIDAKERLWGGSATRDDKIAIVANKRLEEIKALKEAEAEQLAKYNVGGSVLEDLTQ
jgi:hypothetical protein